MKAYFFLFSVALFTYLLSGCGGGGGGSDSENIRESPRNSTEPGAPGESDSGNLDPTPEEAPTLNCDTAGIELNDLLTERRELESAIWAKTEQVRNQESVVERACSNSGVGGDNGPSPEESDPEEGDSTSDVDSDYTRLPALTGIDKYADNFMPVYRSPEDGWAMIEEMCGPVGSWDHEITVAYGQEAQSVSLRKTDGCIHVKGIPGPNGELPEFNVTGPTSFHAGENVRRGGVFVENIKEDSIAVPAERHFLVMHNVHLSNWSNHAIITPTAAKHLYIEIVDSYMGNGNNNHAAYIDNVAYAHVRNSVFESPGRQHAFRSIAQAGLYVGNTFCNIQCDGTILSLPSGRQLIGAPPLDIYVNGNHTLRDNKVVYYRKSSSAYQAVNHRRRPAINTLDRYDDGTDQYNYLTWGTDEYNDPATWEKMPMIETHYQNLEIECLGQAPCHAFTVGSTYPLLHNAQKNKLVAWWKENKFETWEDLLAHAHPSWHGVLNLMTPEYRQRKLEDGGRGLPWTKPFSVTEDWQQKSRLILENVTGNFQKFYDVQAPQEGSWCYGDMDGGSCQRQNYYRQAEVIMR